MKIQLPSQVQELAEKQMDRKEFLKHTAAIAVFVAGGGVIIQSILKGLNFGSKPETQKAAMGYGASVYGGARNR